MCFSDGITASFPGLSFYLLFCRCCHDYHHLSLPRAFSEQVTPAPEFLRTSLQLIYVKQLHLWTNTYNETYRTFAHTSLRRQLRSCTSLPDRHVLYFLPGAYSACVAWCCFSSFLLLPIAMAGSGACVLFQWSAAVDFLHRCFLTGACSIRRWFLYLPIVHPQLSSQRAKVFSDLLSA